jgi:periplasmic divalent cation tolerance protein
VLITAPPEDARRLASQLVAQRLAACVNVVPRIESFYWWEEAVQHDDEALLICKTVERQFDKLRAFVKEHHPYDLPEIIALPVTAGLPEYLEWVGKETGGD